MTAPDSSVSPGIGGFLAFFLLGCALWLLMRSLVVRLRNVDRRGILEDEQAEAARAGRATTRPSSAGRAVPDGAAPGVRESGGPDEPGRDRRGAVVRAADERGPDRPGGVAPDGSGLDARPVGEPDDGGTARG